MQWTGICISTARRVSASVATRAELTTVKLYIMQSNADFVFSSEIGPSGDDGPGNVAKSQSTVVLSTLEASRSGSLDKTDTNGFAAEIDVSAKLCPEESSLEMCPICLCMIATVNDSIKTPCGHSFHSVCLRKANRVTYPNHRCPICRSPLESSNFDAQRFEHEIWGINRGSTLARNRWNEKVVGSTVAVAIISSCILITFLIFHYSEQNGIKTRCTSADFKSQDGSSKGITFYGVSNYFNGQNISYCDSDGNCQQSCEYVCKAGWGHLKAIKESSFIPLNVSLAFIQPCIWCKGLGMWSPGGNVSLDGKSSFPQPCYPCKTCSSTALEISPCSPDRDTVCHEG